MTVLPETASTHVDVLIVGAGLSGIGAAWHLQDKQPGRSYAILEARGASGGTWDLFRYPGIRSDSDLSTFAYAFKPWTGEKAIADGPEILEYIRRTASENGIDEHIRYGHKVVAADWSSEEARWTVTAERADTGETVTLTCGWLFCASGYYDYDQGFSPSFPGAEDFAGQTIHPQHWPEDLEVEGKRIVVIGSGATAVTLIPALAARGAQVTMLQRSPSYIMSLPSRDVIADKLRAWFGDARGHELTRRKNIFQQRKLYSFCQKHPTLARRIIRKLTEKQLPAHIDVDTHFKPKYGPWDQRLCAVPNGDLFRALRAGTADIVTDAIQTFTPAGVRLQSGTELPADIIVTATGLNLKLFGGVQATVDGEAVNPADCLAFRGMMLSGMPNFAFAIGYTNSSWTLKVDLVCEHLCRLLAHMDAARTDTVVPVHDDPSAPTRPLMDFGAGYVQRALDQLPKQGADAPWHLAMDYREDVEHLRNQPLEHTALAFERRAARDLAVAA
ncbi:NAD(P)/FAD-dependent oxidoreductase [Paraconexibacter antarcticus]|uniref:NAD(P)/FAD-dependent oxidoreductase n=1 Tax=Paraconexibacter antarcticus TaxID=2949664 RepID=A0ABY5DTK1_9ACTN|nr:NAD(P)/FAD-dependent oxidoreductase [Paraconexibacter antarcticus]UTI65361.1 NAD(P)/FAD-dependent oxidoreductase [Paraconexibacter antarcticus]